jgi:hypothetical protein
MTTRIKLRRDTAANWTANDPVLALGEAGYDTTNNELRVGDGTTVWSLLSAVGGTSNKITAEKTYSDNYSDGSEHTFTYTTGSIAVQMGNDDGFDLNDLLSRWVNYFDGDLTYPFNYSNINLVINPGTDNLASTVTNVISAGNDPELYTITLGTAHAGPITINDIDFNSTYVNTIGLDTVNDYFGMATGDDSIEIRSGVDIDLYAADDIWMEAGDNLRLLLVNRNDNSSSDGIDIRTETTATGYTWTFRFDGSLTVPGDILDSDGLGLFASLVHTTNNMWHVDPSRTDTYTANGSVLKPFKTIAAALAYIEAKIADTSLTITINGAVVDNPQFIFLKTSITENVTLTRGNIFIVGDTPDAGHVPIWINGYVDIVPSDSSGNAINVNRFGLFHVAVKPSTANHAIQVTGTNPTKLYLQDVYCYQANATKSCVYANNTGTGSRVEMYDCTLGRSSGSTYLIDIQRGFCSINNLETNGIGQVLNMANDSTGNMLRSGIDANTGSVVTLSGSVQWGMGVCILNNSGAGANTYGVSMSGSASMQFGVCTFNIPAGNGSNRAINGTSTNTVLYADPIFQYGSTNKISSAIMLFPLTKTFTAV